MTIVPSYFPEQPFRVCGLPGIAVSPKAASSTQNSRETQLSAGGVETCGCIWCRDFLLVRDHTFPPAFADLLHSLGINPHRGGEVYHNGRLAPGRHDYAGWFHFIGSLDRTGDFPPVELGDGFTAWLCPGSAPALQSLKGKPLVQLEFHCTDVPWRLDEPEPV